RSVTDTTPEHTISVDWIAFWIKGGLETPPRWVRQINDLRKSGADKARFNRLKQQLPAFTWSGTFSKRNNESLIEYSGLLCIDLDDLGDFWGYARDLIRDNSPYWRYLFRSPSSHGLKAVFAVDPDPGAHKESFDFLSSHLVELCGSWVKDKIDNKCKDL